MKHVFPLMLILCFFCSGCSSVTGERIKEPVTFYYVCENYQKNMDQVIGAEIREAAGHKNDLSYLLALYSMGPSREDLLSPIPRNTTIVPIVQTEEAMEVSLSESALTMSDAEFTLASACISMTCMELTDVQQVTVVCEDRHVSIREDNLLLYNDLVEIPQEEGK